MINSKKYRVTFLTYFQIGQLVRLVYHIIFHLRPSISKPFFLFWTYNFLPITNNDFNNNHGGGLKIILNLTPTLKALSVFFFVYSIFFEDNLRLNSKWVYFVNNNSCKNGDKKEFSSCPTIPHSCVVYIACLGLLKKRRCL